MRELKLPDPRNLSKLSPEWWSAIGGAAVAGAVLFPSSRFTAGAVGALAMAAIALMFGTPCCAGCAGASSAPTAPPPPSAEPSAPNPDNDADALMASSRGCLV